ncbi:MAG: hypothetical protein P9L88_05185 [Candidatus Tantalella remota]|nr:hypothetical protein [Candidatus Tantalella remota]
MYTIYGRKHNHIMKVISILTLVIFIFSFVLRDAWAAVEKSGRMDRVKSINIDTFFLPIDLGMVRYIHKGNSDKVLIHIQDAHCNYPAQKKIAEILEYVNAEYGVKEVNLEGGAGSYDLSVFTDIYDKGVREKVADYFVQWGRVNGAEFYALNNPNKVTLWGVEEPDLYMENLDVYRNSLAYKEQALEYISLLDHYLANLKKQMYSPELLEIDTEYIKYKTNAIEFKDYLLFLLGKAKVQGINIKDYPNIYLLSQSMEQEDNVDFKKANKERDALIERLQGVLSKSELKELLAKTVAFRNKVIPQNDFYEYLITKAKASNLEMEQFPELRKFIIYVSLYNAVDKTIIMQEIETLESDIKNLLFQNEKQRELYNLSKNLVLTKNIFEVAFTREDYRYYKENKASFDVDRLVSFIKKEAPAYGISVKLPSEINKLNEYRDEMFNFFEISFKRDDAFIDNLKFSGEVVKTGALVTGGFHTDNMCELLRKNDISYISIIPNFRIEKGYECPYFRVLAGGVSPVEAAIDLVALSLIQVASMMNQLGAEADGAEKAEIFELGVEAITAFVEGDGRPIGVQFEGTTGSLVIRMNDETGFPELSMVSGVDITDAISIQNLNESFKADPEGVKAAMKALFSEVAQDAVIARAINNGEDTMLLTGDAAVEQTKGLVDSLAQPVMNEMLANTDIRLINGLTLPHAGGQGIYMPADITDTEQPYIIVHELIAGIYEGDATRDSHQLARAVENALRSGDAGAARTLLANATRHTTDREGEGKVERTIWEMTQGERWNIPRDYAAGTYDIDTPSMMTNEELKYYNSRRKKNNRNFNARTRVQALRGARSSQKRTDIPDLFRMGGVLVEALIYFAIFSGITFFAVGVGTSLREPVYMLKVAIIPTIAALGVITGITAKKEGELTSDLAQLIGGGLYGLIDSDYFLDPDLDPVDTDSKALRKLVGRDVVRDLSAVIPEDINGQGGEKFVAQGIVRDIVNKKAEKSTADVLRKFLAPLEGSKWHDYIQGGVEGFLDLQNRTSGTNNNLKSEEDIKKVLDIVFSLQGRDPKRFGDDEEAYFKGVLGRDQGLSNLAGLFTEQYGVAVSLSMTYNITAALRGMNRVRETNVQPFLKAVSETYTLNFKNGAMSKEDVRKVFASVAIAKSVMEQIYERQGAKYDRLGSRLRLERNKEEYLSFDGMPFAEEALVVDAVSRKQPSPVAASLIGTVRSSDGTVYEGGFAILDDMSSGPVVFGSADERAGVSGFEVAKALDDNGDVIERNASDVFASLEDIFARSKRSTLSTSEVEMLKQLFADMNITRVVALEDNARVKGAIAPDAGILYLNKSIVDNPLALLHELGEGNISIPVGFEAITRHTLMRGVGKDVRDAHISLARREGSEYIEALSVDGYVGALRSEMTAMGKPREMTTSEMELIRYNGLQERQDPGVGKELLLYGLQDHLDPDRNIALTLQIRGIRDDFKGGAVNFHVIRNSNLSTMSSQAKHAQSFARTARRKEGLEQRVFNFNGSEPLGEALKSALDRAIVVINEQNAGVKGREGAFPKISVACQTEQDIKDVDKFFADNPDYASYRGLVAIVNDDMGEADLSTVKIDQSKLIAVGDILCNNKRLMDDYPEMSLSDKTAIFKKDLVLFRSLGFFEGADITDIDFEDMSQSDIVDVMKNIFNGVYSMRITRVNINEIQEWNEAQQEILRAL